MNDKIPLLVICGPTASGKTAVGAELARRLDGEVISADSMQIYKNMDIVTAVPSMEERLGVPHHLMNILDTDDAFSVADYVKLASEVIREVHSRGKLPVVVGGTGLYISSLADNISFEEAAADSTVRSRLEEEARLKGRAYMLEKLRSVDPAAAERLHENNVIRIIRALELFETTGRSFDENMRISRERESPYELCMIGLNYENRQDLYDRIDRRVTLMAENGMVEEAERVYRSGGMKTAAQAIGFKELIPYFEGREDKESCLDKIRQSTRHYAKRQLTWFRRDARICWVNLTKNEQSDKILEKCLNIVAKSKIMCYNNK
ncbi:MAG: tRNA (adenosine(37)-N6)-dimethylallyltransferase MiaA [Oscillospiraceae bacterium]